MSKNIEVAVRILRLTLKSDVPSAVADALVEMAIEVLEEES